MVDKQKCLHTLKGKKKGINDPCPVCEENLYYDDDYTRRIGLLDNYDELEGWMCPYCRATFDNFNNLSYIRTVNTTQGKA